MNVKKAAKHNIDFFGGLGDVLLTFRRTLGSSQKPVQQRTMIAMWIGRGVVLRQTRKLRFACSSALQCFTERSSGTYGPTMTCGWRRAPRIDSRPNDTFLASAYCYSNVYLVHIRAEISVWEPAFATDLLHLFSGPC